MSAYIKYTYLFCFFMVYRLFVFGQDDPFKPKSMALTPSTPNASIIEKFGEYPVDFSSGLVDISIPLYEIKSSKLSLPIVLKYHPSGIKPGDQASCVGLGWSLSAGGMISRTVKDKIDESTFGYLDQDNTIRPYTSLYPDDNLTDYYYVKSFLEFSDTKRDGQADLFSYSLSSKNGQFFFSKDKTTTITIPYDKVQITYEPNFASIKIIDTDGTTYIFGKTLNGITYNEDAQMQTGIGNDNGSTRTGWMLTTIISADQSDKIELFYTGDQLEYDYGITDEVELWDRHVGYGPILGGTKLGMHTPAEHVAHFLGHQQTLDYILFKNGKVVFEKDARTDGNGGLGKKVNRISIYTQDALTSIYSKVKSIDFSYSYFGTTNSRLKLDGIALNGSDDAPVENYSFSYNNTNINISPNTRSIDYWGFYNGASNQTLLSTQMLNNGAGGPWNLGQCDRSPNLSATQSCVLNSITFPTGGRTEFTYELNRYNEYNVGNFDAGGLRIKQIKSFDGNNPIPITKTYTYGKNEDGIGILVAPFSFSYFSTTYKLQHIDVSAIENYEEVWVTNFYCNPTSGTTGMDGRIVYYDYVTEYLGDEANNNGKTVYHFDYTGDTYMQYSYVKGNSFRQNYSWKRGHLLNQTSYTAGGAPNYTKVMGYGQIKQQWYSETGYIVNQKFNLDNSSVAGPDSRDGQYDYHPISIETGNYKLISTTEYFFDQKDRSKYQTKLTNYEYDPSIYEPSKITSYTNDGYNVTSLKYPLNYNTNVTTSDVFINGIKNLTAINNLTQPIEQYKQSFKSDNTSIGITEAVLTQFKSDKPYPEVIYKLERTAPITTFTVSAVTGTTFTKDSRYKPEIQFSSYLNGNLVQQQKVNDIIKSYIWDYNFSLPIAEVTNSSSTEIAYTSFESTGMGNWTGFNTANISTAIAPVTGLKVYNFSGTTLSKSGLTSSKSYIVSYWSNSGAYTVNGTSATGWPKSIKTVTIGSVNWTLWEDKINGVATATISGTGYIDELRLYPANAQMATYTHKPLTGVSSICDINNMTSYFDYDEFGRLKLTKDFKGNITKTYLYKYQANNP